MGEQAKARTHSIPKDILDELAARFIINIPAEEKTNLVRVCFQLELAHWFYIDFYVTGSPELKLVSGTIKEFAAHIFRHVPFLQQHVGRVEEVVDEWREYKLAVPTYGAIILSPGLDKVLLVQGFWAKASWGFPKGKVNEEEPPAQCAAREVMEEIGYDITERLDPEEYLEQVINDQTVRLYVIHGVEETTKFQTNTRCEIRDIKWFPLDALPMNKTDQSSKAKLGVAPNNFFMVIPFLREIKAWVKLVAAATSLLPQSSKKKSRVRREEELVGEPSVGEPIEQPPLAGGGGDRGRVASQAGEIRRPVAKKPSVTTPRASVERQGATPKTSVERQGATPRASVERQGATPKVSVERQGATPRASVERQGATPKVSVERQGATPRVSGHTPRSSMERQTSSTSVSTPGASVEIKGITARTSVPTPRASVERQTARVPLERQTSASRDKVLGKEDSAEKRKKSRKKLFAAEGGVGEGVREGSRLLPPGFLPQAWTNFRLDHSQIMAAAMGGR